MLLVEKGEHLNIYNIGNPEEVSIAELVKRVFAHFGKTADLQPSEAPKGETSRRCPDISKLRALGFEPRISLNDGLRSLVDWYVENRHLKPS